MTNLPKGTTIDGNVIITSVIENQHSHLPEQVIGLSEEALGNEPIYAEKIDGKTYSEIIHAFVGDTNDTMLGSLLVASTSSNELNVISNNELENIMNNLGIREYHLSTVPPTISLTEQSSVPNSDVTGKLPTAVVPTIYRSREAAISIITIDGLTWQDGEDHFIVIMNYDSFSTYSVETTFGTVEIADGFNGFVRFTNSHPIEEETNGIITITKNNTVTKDIPFTLIPQPPIDDNWVVGTLGAQGIDSFVSVTKSSNSGYVAVGFQNSQGQGASDALIVKYDEDINLVSQHSLGGIDNDYYNAVIEASDGTFVAAGHQASEANGVFNALIVKYDSNLEVITQQTIGSNGDVEQFNGVTEDADGNFIAVGSTTYNQNNTDALIIKYGLFLSPIIVSSSLGSGSLDIFRSVTTTVDNYIIVVGYTRTQSLGLDDCLIVKYDTNLNIISQKALGGIGSDTFDSVIETSSGNILTVGTQRSETGNNNGLIALYDSNLNLITQRSLGQTSNVTFRSVSETNDGYYVVCGSTNSGPIGSSSSALVVVYDSNLNLVSQRILGGSGSDSFNGVLSSSNNMLVAVGTQTSQGQGSNDALIAKMSIPLDADGVIENHTGLDWYASSLVGYTSNLTPYDTSFNAVVPSFVYSGSSTLIEDTTTLVETRSEKQ